MTSNGPNRNARRIGLAFVLAASIYVPMKSLAQQTTQKSQDCGKAAEAFAETTQRFASTGDRQVERDGYKHAIILDPYCSAAWFNLGVLAEADNDWMLLNPL